MISDIKTNNHLLACYGNIILFGLVAGPGWQSTFALLAHLILCHHKVRDIATQHTLLRIQGIEGQMWQPAHSHLANSPSPFLHMTLIDICCSAPI